jgi:HEAT repeat protein
MFGLPPLPRTLGAALRDVGHERPHVRKSALGDLVRLAGAADGRAQALSALERVLSNDPVPEMRAGAAVGLADAEARESVGAVSAALDDADPGVRQMAMLAFGELATPGDAGHVERARALLGAPDAPVRFQALIAFVRLCPKEAERAFMTALADDDAEVRAMALRLMDTRYAEEPAPAHLVGRARSALGDPMPAVRVTAALFLAHRGERAADAVLVGIIDGTVPALDAGDLVSAIEAAATEKLESARAGLRYRAFGVFGVRSDPIAWHALVALAMLGDERARASILRGLSAWTRHARTMSAFAAGRAGLVEARARIDAWRGRHARADQDVVNDALAALDAHAR